MLLETIKRDSPLCSVTSVLFLISFVLSSLSFPLVERLNRTKQLEELEDGIPSMKLGTA